LGSDVRHSARPASTDGIVWFTSAHRMWAERPPGVGAYVTNGGANVDAANGGAIVHQRGWRS